MITKITINDIASFKQEQSLETDKKVNLIYGLNGVGKTTISNYLQELDNQKFSDCSIKGFNSDDQKILVYNQNFIQKVFYNDETQKGIFTLGEDNKEAKQNIKQAESKIADLSSKLDDEQGNGLNFDYKNKHKEIGRNQIQSQEKVWKVITNDKKTGDNVFDKNNFFQGCCNTKPKLFNHISSLELSNPQRDINQIKQELQDLGSKAEQRIKLTSIELEPFSNIENNSIFDTQIIGNDNSSVSGLIKKLDNQDWVKQGIDNYVDLGDRENCPFCQKATLDSNLVGEIKSYFDDSYQENIEKLTNIKTLYQELKNALSLENQQRDFFTKEQKLELKNLHDGFVQTLDKNLGSINNKLNNPSKPVEILSSKDQINQLNDFIVTINTEIESFNIKLDNRNETIKDLKDEFWQIQRKEYDQTISNYLTTRDSLKAEQQQIQEQIDATNKEISKQKQIISQNQSKVSNVEKTIEKINSHLLDFGIYDFKITLHNKQEKTYKLQRGTNLKSIFKTLSEGEKTVISFLYFVELCIGEESQGEVKQKIVVIDDPISSLSHIYVFNVAELLKEHFIGKDTEFSQCFILTHNLYFFNELITQTRNNCKNRKLFRVSKNENSQISEMVSNEVQNDYQSYWSIVKNQNENNKFMVANAMRNIIEYFFGFMEKQQDLNNIFKKHELSNNKYQAFKRYINRESHSDLTNISDFKDFDLNKFQVAFKKVFKETGYEDHYKQMIL